MASGAGFVLAAGALEIANEAVFAPLDQHKTAWNFNWRIVPATAILAIVITGLEKVNAPFGKAMGGLVLIAVLIIPFGNAPTPIDNLTKLIGVK